jgi:NADH dehydrogenase FAD-containing subunit
MSKARHRVVVVGGGFGGVRVTRALARALTFTKNRPHRTITAELARHELTSGTAEDAV